MGVIWRRANYRKFLAQVGRQKQNLQFTQPLLADAAKREVLLFVAQQHDARIGIVSDVWDHVIDSANKQFEGPSWAKFCTHFITALSNALTAQVESKWSMKKMLK